MILLILRCLFAYWKLLFTRKKKRSCVVIPTFEAYGGTRTYFISLIKFLYKQGYDTTVMLLPSQIDEEIKSLQLEHDFAIELLQFDVWRTNFRRPFFSSLNKNYFVYQLQELFYFCRVLRNTRSGVLICSVSNPEELLFLFLCPLKIVYVLHTSTFDKLDRLKRFLLSFRLSKKRQIVTVSNFAKELILDNWTKGKKVDHIQVVYNYYYPKNSFSSVNPTTKHTVFTAGTVAVYKNPIFWVDVCKKVISILGQEITFVWAGDGNLLDECRALADDFPQIKFVGFRANIEELYAECSIYFQPSVFESHGISVLGAMYFEKPCIVSNRGGLPESVINNETGYVVKIEDVDEATSAICNLVKDRHIAEQMGRKGKEKFEKYFTRDIWEEKMTSIMFQ